MVTNNIAIILARAGSKRLPKKNILNLGGKPLIAWSIEAAVRSKVFTKILVSTDCKLIADISIKYGAEVPFLRNENSDDFSKSSLATYTALNQAEKYWKIKFDVVTQLMANCPLRTERDIRKSTNVFIKKNIPAQISCSKFGWMNPFWAFKLDKKKRAKFLFPNKKWEKDFSPLDEFGTSYVDRDYSKAYVRHLFVAKEYLAKQIASIHNLAFYLDLVKVAREHIIAGDFYEWKEQIIPQLKQRL
jgi:CMP-N-acetylneuraminic acid synthetase